MVNIVNNLVSNLAQSVNLPAAQLCVPDKDVARIWTVVSRNLEVIKVMANDVAAHAKNDIDLSDLQSNEYIIVDNLGFTSLDGFDSRILAHEEIERWIWKGTKESQFMDGQAARRVATIEVDPEIHMRAHLEARCNLLRPIISCKMQQVIDQKNLTELAVVEDRFVVNREAAIGKPMEENLLVFSKKETVATSHQTAEAFLLMDLEKQKRIAQQMCTFIQETGMVDNHFGNLRFALLNEKKPEDFMTTQMGRNGAVHLPRKLNPDELQDFGKLTIIDTELHGMGKTAPERAELGIINFRNALIQVFGERPMPEELKEIFDAAIEDCRSHAPDLDYIRDARDKITVAELVDTAVVAVATVSIMTQIARMVTQFLEAIMRFFEGMDKGLNSFQGATLHPHMHIMYEAACNHHLPHVI